MVINHSIKNQVIFYHYSTSVFGIYSPLVNSELHSIVSSYQDSAFFNLFFMFYPSKYHLIFIDFYDRLIACQSNFQSRSPHTSA